MPPDYFKLFDIPRAFDVDLNLLTMRYRDLQRAVHPDRFVRSTAQERRLAMEHASDVNQGYRTLKDPVERALHLLRLLGVDVDDPAGNALDPAFLMEQMELRESLGEIRARSGDSKDLAGIFAAIDRLESQITADLRRAFMEAGGVPLNSALNNIQKLRFVNKLRAEARDIEEHHER